MTTPDCPNALVTIVQYVVAAIMFLVTMWFLYGKGKGK
jgi:hypothetical protein